MSSYASACRATSITYASHRSSIRLLRGRPALALPPSKQALSASVRLLMHRALQANFIRYGGFTVVYRRYASLFFIVGIDNGQVHIRPYMCAERV